MIGRNPMQTTFIREKVGKEHYKKYVELLTYEKVDTGWFSLFKILLQKLE
jgi:hypothetical protein